MRWNNQDMTLINQQIQYRNELLQYCIHQLQSDTNSNTPNTPNIPIVMSKQMQYKIANILSKFAKRQLPQYWDTFIHDMVMFVQYGKELNTNTTNGSINGNSGGNSDSNMIMTIKTSNISILTLTCLLEDCLLTDFNHSETLPSHRKHDILLVISTNLGILLSICYNVIFEYATYYMTTSNNNNTNSSSSNSNNTRQAAADLVNATLHMLIPLTTVCSTPNELFNDTTTNTNTNFKRVLCCYYIALLLHT